MQPLKVLIVDDEAHARAALRGMIAKNFTDIEIVGEAPNLPEAVKAINRHHPQVVLLDIEMPGYLGLDILDFFDESQLDFSIIFVTAYNDYALKAFELAAVDYLLKPTSVEQLARALNRVRALRHSATENAQYQSLKQHFEQGKPQRIALQTAEGLLLMPIHDILYFKADSSYTHIFFANGNKLIISRSLQEYNALTELGSFMRVHRSYNVNLNRVQRIVKADGGYLVMENGDEIPISQEKRQLIYDFFKGTIF